MAGDDRPFRAPKGTRDLLPPESWEWREVTELAIALFSEAGYAPIETPAFEHTEVFERGVGATSEVVNKQMYTFTDLGGRSLTLRPEGTASVVRAVLEHGLHRGPLPVKLSYAEWMFRQERPQKGRYRQFSQVGMEAIGSDSPIVDAEVIEVGRRFYSACGLETTLMLNSIGHPDSSCRQSYGRILADFLEAHRDALAPEDRERIETNPLRTFDSKAPATIDVMRDAPLISEHLCDACRKHFESVCGLLDDLGVPYQLEPRLVRGLDYYTRTAFEFVAGNLGSQNAVGGGGRYDGLSEALGGPPLPGIGIAPGIERILLAREAEAEAASRSHIDVYFVSMGEEAASVALKLATSLRRERVGADVHVLGKSVKAQMKDAVRSGARWAVILGDDELATGEATLKNLESQEQRRVAFDDLLRAVSSQTRAGSAGRQTK
jgi:histidyl-tRNA synthetase